MRRILPGILWEERNHEAHTTRDPLRKEGQCGAFYPDPLGERGTMRRIVGLYHGGRCITRVYASLPSQVGVYPTQPPCVPPCDHPVHEGRSGPACRVVLDVEEARLCGRESCLSHPENNPPPARKRAHYGQQFRYRESVRTRAGRIFQPLQNCRPTPLRSWAAVSQHSREARVLRPGPRFCIKCSEMCRKCPIGHPIFQKVEKHAGIKTVQLCQKVKYRWLA